MTDRRRNRDGRNEGRDAVARGESSERDDGSQAKRKGENRERSGWRREKAVGVFQAALHYQPLESWWCQWSAATGRRPLAVVTEYFA